METHQTSREAGAAPEHLEAAGNCRQNVNTDQEPNLHLLSEHRKLRHVLDWAHRFLSSRSELHREFCRADSLILATEKDEEKRETSYEDLEKFKYLRGFESPSQDEPDVPSCRRDDIAWPENRETENMKSRKRQHSTNHQSPRQDFCTTNRLNTSRQRCQTHTSDSSKNQTLTAATWASKGSASCWSDAICKNKTVSKRDSEDRSCKIKSKGETLDNRKEVKNQEDGKKKQGSTSASLEFADDKMSHSETPCPLKTPSHGSVYEQYQLCVERLHRLRTRPSVSPAQGKETRGDTEARPPSCPKFNSSTTNPEIEKYFRDATTTTEERTSDDISKSKERTTSGRGRRATLPKHEETKCRDDLSLRKNRRSGQTSSVYCSEGDFMKKPAGARTSTEDSRSEGGAAPPANSVFQPKETERRPGLKCQQSDVRGQKKTSGGRGPQRPHPAEANQCTKRHTPEDRLKHTSPYRDTPTVPQPPGTHGRHNGDTTPTSPVSETAAHGSNTDCKHTPAAVPACDRWLRLPDEVWLSVLSLLPHTDLCRVTQVCSRLHALATDHTLWKNARIENVTLTEQRLLFWGQRRPRSLCLFSCSGLSVTADGLQGFFTLCKNYLEDVKVTSCTGPGLHGDQILPQIGQLCDHVTSVDVSWSGATDVGVKALSDSCAGLRLKSVVLNGCHVTDDPLKKLVMRHRESLCRLEVFGCQFLTASCLQAIYEMCPGLKHLNIGQVPKVNAHSLTVMPSQIKCLVSLNLTGLQAVSDVTVATLLQSYVELESLTLSSCPGVTDLTLHNIRKYTPCIRSLDVSGCKAVTDAGVQSLTLGCGRLQQLDLSSTGAGNRGVTLLANYCSKHLQTVKLSFCHITSENILKLCRRSKRLKLLHVYGCAHLPSEREIREVNAIVKVHPLS